MCNAPAHYEKVAHYEKIGALRKYVTHYKKNWYPKPVNGYPKPETRTRANSGLDKMKCVSSLKSSFITSTSRASHDKAFYEHLFVVLEILLHQ